MATFDDELVTHAGDAQLNRSDESVAIHRHVYRGGALYRNIQIRIRNREREIRWRLARHQAIPEPRSATLEEVFDSDRHLSRIFGHREVEPGIGTGTARREQREYIFLGRLVAGGSQLLALRVVDAQHAIKTRGAEAPRAQLQIPVVTG